MTTCDSVLYRYLCVCTGSCAHQSSPKEHPCTKHTHGFISWIIILNQIQLMVRFSDFPFSSLHGGVSLYNFGGKQIYDVAIPHVKKRAFA